MIDEKKLIEYLETLTEFERKKSQESAEIGAFDMATCYGHGEYCYKNAINAAEEQPKIGGWIPCSERLPDKDGEYICTQKIYNLSNGKLSGKSVELVEFYNGKWRRAKHLKVIAWQPLPEEYHE